ncbi:MAG: Wzz/FepE/Etk N-terminal domain-containing protein [Bacteroidota bacterium]
MDNIFNNVRLLDIIIKWKFHLLAVIIAAVLLSVLFSSPIFITPLYKSYAIVYPSNISPYSDENETEQMIQMLQSRDIRDSVVHKFNLPKHWGVDSTYEYFVSTMVWYWEQRVIIAKTPNEAVEIEVLDPDPQVACDMVSAIIEYYNAKVRSLHKEKFGEVVQNYDFIMNQKQQYMDSLSKQATELGTKYGILEYEGQTREVMRAYFQNKGSGEVQKYKRNLEEHGGEIMKLGEMMRSESEALATLKLDADRALLDFHRRYTHANVLSKPFAADKKSFPVRWLIVVMSTVAALFFALIVAGIIENRKNRSLNAAQQG